MHCCGSTAEFEEPSITSAKRALTTSVASLRRFFLLFNRGCVSLPSLWPRHLIDVTPYQKLPVVVDVFCEFRSVRNDLVEMKWGAKL